MFDRAAEIRRCESIVDYQGHPSVMRNLRHSRDVQHVDARVADRLAIEQPCARSNGAAEVFWILRVNEDRVDSQPAETHVQLRICAAVECARGHNLVAWLHQACEYDELRCLSAG